MSCSLERFPQLLNPFPSWFFGLAMQISLCSQEGGRSPAITITITIVSVCPVCPDSAQRWAHAPTGQEGLPLEARGQGERGTKYCHQTTSFVKTYHCQRVMEQNLYQPPRWASARAFEPHSVLESCANSTPLPASGPSTDIEDVENTPLCIQNTWPHEWHLSCKASGWGPL